jgi:hypothetical protein
MKDYLIATIATVTMLAGPWIFALAVAAVVPALGAVALGVGIVAIPALVMHFAL